MRVVPAVLVLLFCLCGCSAETLLSPTYDALQSACVSVENQTGHTIEILTVNGGEDLLPYGSLAPNTTVRLAFVPQSDQLYTIEAVLQGGDCIEFPPARLEPGAEVCLQLQLDAPPLDKNR